MYACRFGRLKYVVLMESRIKLVLSVAMLLGTVVAASADVVNVSPAGDDVRGDGSVVRPFASLQRALDYAAALPKNDTLFIRVGGGEYRLYDPVRITPDNSGTAAAPLVIEGAGMDATVFRGSVTFGGFQRYDDKVWRVRVPRECRGGFEQIYVGGERRFRAQLPDRGGFLEMERVDEFVIDSSATNRTGKNWAVLKVTLDDGTASRLGRMPRAEWNDAIFNFYHKWDVTRLRLQYLDAAQGEAYFAEEGMMQWNPIDVKSRLVVENCSAALDSAGEWYFDRSEGWLYYIPADGENPETLEVSVPVVEKFLEITGDEASGRRAGHVILRDLSFREAGYRTPADGNAACRTGALRGCPHGAGGSMVPPCMPQFSPAAVPPARSGGERRQDRRAGYADIGYGHAPYYGRQLDHTAWRLCLSVRRGCGYIPRIGQQRYA